MYVFFFKRTCSNIKDTHINPRPSIKKPTINSSPKKEAILSLLVLVIPKILLPLILS